MARGYKTGGRSAGTPNKRTEEFRESIRDALALIDGNVKKFEEDIKSLSPIERLKFYCALLEYVQPKLARTETKLDAKLLDIGFSVVAPTDAEVEILKRLAERDK